MPNYIELICPITKEICRQTNPYIAQSQCAGTSQDLLYGENAPQGPPCEVIRRTAKTIQEEMGDEYRRIVYAQTPMKVTVRIEGNNVGPVQLFSACRGKLTVLNSTVASHFEKLGIPFSSEAPRLESESKIKPGVKKKKHH